MDYVQHLCLHLVVPEFIVLFTLFYGVTITKIRHDKIIENIINKNNMNENNESEIDESTSI